MPLENPDKMATVAGYLDSPSNPSQREETERDKNCYVKDKQSNLNCEETEGGGCFKPFLKMILIFIFC